MIPAILALMFGALVGLIVWAAGSLVALTVTAFMARQCRRLSDHG